MERKLVKNQPKTSLKNRLRSAKWHRDHPERVRELKKHWRDRNPGWHLKYVEENRELIYMRNRKRWESVRSEIFELLGDKCAWPGCGWTDKRALQIDDVNGGGNKRKRSAASATSYYKQILNEIKAGSKDYQLLCANHNWIKRWENHEYAPNARFQKEGDKK